jgi:hypothetical protein
MGAEAESLAEQFAAIEAELDAATTGTPAPAAKAPPAEKAAEIEASAEKAPADGTQQSEPAAETEPETEEQTEEPEKAETESEEKPKPAVSAIPEDREAQRKLLTELTQKLGLILNEARVEPADWVKHRQEKRAAREKLEQREQALTTREGEFSKSIESYEAAKKAAASGDYDAFLKATIGMDLTEVNRRHVDGMRGRDPELEREKEFLRKERERIETERKEVDTKRREEREAEQRRAYVAQVHEHFAKHEQPPLQRLAEVGKRRPELIGMIVAEQERAYDPDDGQTITADQAAELVLGRLRRDYDALAEIFGSRPASQAEVTQQQASGQPQEPAKRAAKNRTVPQRKASGASAPGRSMSDEEFFRIAKAEMEKAAAADREAGLI